MSKLLNCPLCGNEVYWYPDDCNERGWRCCRQDDCGHRPGEPPGFDPERDRHLIDMKVEAILMDLATHDFVYLSNSGCGEGVAASVAERCKRHERYDQWSVLLYIMQVLAPGHGDYWKRISDGILAGEDPRDRCHCGELSTSCTISKGTTTYHCSKHWEVGK